MIGFVLLVYCQCKPNECNANTSNGVARTKIFLRKSRKTREKKNMHRNAFKLGATLKGKNSSFQSSHYGKEAKYFAFMSLYCKMFLTHPTHIRVCVMSAKHMTRYLNLC